MCISDEDMTISNMKEILLLNIPADCACAENGGG